VVQHLTHANPYGGFVPERYLCEGVAHENEVNASRLGELSGRAIPRGDGGEVATRGVHDAHVGNGVSPH
jgi:hypothetical protein